MLKSYSSDTIKVPIIGNEEDIWSGVSDTAKSEIFYIMQELMTNMRKHSKADRVMIDFERENNLLSFYIQITEWEFRNTFPEMA
jgi:signal transduction histidine kinase